MQEGPCCTTSWRQGPLDSASLQTWTKGWRWEGPGPEPVGPELGLPTNCRLHTQAALESSNRRRRAVTQGPLSHVLASGRGIGTTSLLRESWSELPAPEAGPGSPLPALAVKLPWTRAPSGHVANRPLTQLVSPPDWGTATVISLLEAVLALQGLGADLCHPEHLLGQPSRLA